MSRPLFTPEELAELAAADAEIDAAPLTLEDYREKVAAQQKAYYEANREKVAAQRKAYYEANREKYNAYMREYRRKNKEVIHHA